jgi:uncharacterized protein (TIGR03086 family)
MLAETFDGPIGPAPGAVLLHMRINENLVHGWDLARATGQSTEAMPGDLAGQVLTFSQAQIGEQPRTHLPFDEALPAPTDAPAIDRLAAYLGRKV